MLLFYIVRRRSEIIKKYNEIAKQFELPSLEEFEEGLNCEIRSLQVVDEILNIIADRYSFVAGALYSIIEPRNWREMLEETFYTEKEKQEYKKKYQEVVINFYDLRKRYFGSKEQKIEGIKKHYPIYVKQMKPLLVKLYDKLANKWANEKVFEEKPEGKKEKRYFH